MRHYDELSDREKRNFEEFLIATFEFSEEELEAIDKQRPMTMELFSSCLARCTELGLNRFFGTLLNEFPDLADEYIKAIEEELKAVDLPDRTPEEDEESWNRLCERIREVCGKDSI